MLPVNPNGINGNDRGAYWALGNRNVTSNIVVPQGNSFLWLDPRTTSPNVVLGVKAPSGTHYMRPGDVVPLSATRPSTIRVWNAFKDAYQLSAVASAALVGFLGLKSGTAEELPHIIASSGRAPHPRAQLIFAGVVASAAVAQIPCANLTGLRIAVLPVDAGGAFPAVPADFAATIRPGVATAMSVTDPVVPSVNPVDAAPVAAFEDIMPQIYGPNGPTSDQDLVASQTQLSWDRQVVVPAFVLNLTPSGIAGTGISAARLGIFVEGRGP